jgi:dTMP kinase
MTPQFLARRFHELYEELAPTFSYKTRKESAVPWEDVPAANKQLMIAVAATLLDDELACVGQIYAGARQAGCLISLESLDGCGKSTQAKLLADWLADEKFEVHLLREPGGTPLGEVLRSILKDRSKPLSTGAELLLLAASRAQLVELVIAPALADGQIVICDRFVDSTTAYQGGGRQVNTSYVEAVNNIAVDQEYYPDLTILLEAPEEVRKQRLQARDKDTADRFEALGPDFFKRVADSYASITDSRVVRVDASGTPQEVFRLVKEVVNKRLAWLKAEGTFFRNAEEG